MKGEEGETDHMICAIHNHACQTRARYAHLRKPEIPEYQEIVQHGVEPRHKPDDKDDNPCLTQ